MALIPRQGAVPGSSSRGGSPSLSLLYRKSQVFYCAAVVFADYQLCKWRCNQLSLKDDARRDAIWDETHARNAKFLTSQFLSLEGLWVKLGQYLSSRADVMPASYLSELSRCQDSLPPRPFRDIRSIIERELSSSLSQVFASVEESPLACASIAQVHRAQLINGRDVVIKVQHAHVANTMLQDLDNLQTIGDILKRLDADFDFSPVIREWAAEIPKELDFRQEASNMKRVKMNLASMLPSVCSNPSLTIDVSLPEASVSIPLSFL